MIQHHGDLATSRNKKIRYSTSRASGINFQLEKQEIHKFKEMTQIMLF